MTFWIRQILFVALLASIFAARATLPSRPSPLDQQARSN